MLQKGDGDIISQCRCLCHEPQKIQFCLLLKGAVTEKRPCRDAGSFRSLLTCALPLHYQMSDFTRIMTCGIEMLMVNREYWFPISLPRSASASRENRRDRKTNRTSWRG